VSLELTQLLASQSGGAESADRGSQTDRRMELRYGILDFFRSGNGVLWWISKAKSCAKLGTFKKLGPCPLVPPVTPIGSRNLVISPGGTGCCLAGSPYCGGVDIATLVSVSLAEV